MLNLKETLDEILNHLGLDLIKSYYSLYIILMATTQISSSIEVLRKVFQAIKQINNLEYDIGLPLQRGILFIRVKFEPTFPNTAPRIQVASDVLHPLINDKKVVTTPELLNWQPKMTLLAVVNNIYASFTANPPVPDNFVYPNFHEILKNWNEDLQDEQDIIEFVSGLEEVQKLTKVRDEFLESNLEKVNENLKKKEEYDQLISDHQEEINEIEESNKNLFVLMKEVDLINKKYSQEKVLEKLREIENGYNKEASDIQKSFLKKEIGIEEFIESFQVPLKKAKFIQIAREGSKS